MYYIAMMQNDDFNVKVRIDENGNYQFDAESVAISLGLTTVAKSGNVCVRWKRVNEYLKLFGTSAELAKGSYIPEPAVYKLTFSGGTRMKKYLEKETAIDTLARLYERIKREEHDQEAANGVWRAMEAIAALGDAWIPASERLPKKPKENPLYDNKPLEIYLVSVKNTDCVIRAFWNGASFTDGWEKLDVLAWMPLPEPYRPETLRGPGAKAGQDAAEPVFQSAT